MICSRRKSLRNGAVGDANAQNWGGEDRVDATGMTAQEGGCPVELNNWLAERSADAGRQRQCRTKYSKLKPAESCTSAKGVSEQSSAD